jgi:peptidoglycan/LPS O-acetylase OafA/YrhL
MARRLHELDSLRGIAAVCVLLFHLSYHTDHSHQWPIRVPWGHYGVELFFVISGFVILMTLERSATLGDFVVSRLSRLFPAYWCAVLVTSVVLMVLSVADAPGVATIAGNLTMLQPLLGTPYIDGSYWTLSVELVFYFLMSLWFVRRSPRAPGIEVYALAWLVLAAPLRAWLLYKHIELPGYLATPLLLYYGQFFIVGICLYRIHSSRFKRSTVGVLIAACCMSAFGGASASLSPAPIPYFLITCGVTALVFFASRAQPAILRNPTLVFFGLISYPLYLLHQRVGSVALAAAHQAGWPALLSIPGVLCLLVGLAYLIHTFVEAPARRLLRSRLAASHRLVALPALQLEELAVNHKLVPGAQYAESQTRATFEDAPAQQIKSHEDQQRPARHTIG